MKHRRKIDITLALATAALTLVIWAGTLMHANAADASIRWGFAWKDGHNVLWVYNRAHDGGAVRVRCDTPKWWMTARLSPREVEHWRVEDTARKANSSCRVTR